MRALEKAVSPRSFLKWKLRTGCPDFARLRGNWTSVRSCMFPGPHRTFSCSWGRTLVSDRRGSEELCAVTTRGRTKWRLQLLLTPAASQPPPGTGKLQFPKLSEAAARAGCGKPKCYSHIQLSVTFFQGPPVFQMQFWQWEGNVCVHV